MKIDGRFVVFAIPKPACHLLYHLNLVVQPFGRCVGNTMFEIGQDVGDVPFQRAGGRHDRLQAYRGRTTEII